MQLPLPWRYGQKKPFTSIPRINWAHPLAKNLVFYGYDTGSGVILDLVDGRLMKSVGTNDPTKPSAFGSGIAYNLDGTKYFTADAAIRNEYGGNISCACAYVQTANVGNYGKVFYRTGNNDTAQPFADWGFLINPGNIGQNHADFTYSTASGAGHNTSTDWTGNASNVFNTLVGTCGGLPSGHLGFYANGVQIQSGNTGTAYSSTIVNDSICFSGGSDATTDSPFAGFVYYGAFWGGRELTPPEALQLHLNPWCFLIYPEDEVFSTLVGGVIIPPPTIPISFINVY